jgi:hypothetical protein
MKQRIAYESTIERNKITLVDFDPDVQAFEEQPLVILYQYNNKTVMYMPDLLVQTLRKCILVECKPAELVETEGEQFFFFRHGCTLIGYFYFGKSVGDLSI